MLHLAVPLPLHWMHFFSPSPLHWVHFIFAVPLQLLQFVFPEPLQIVHSCFADPQEMVKKRKVVKKKVFQFDFLYCRLFIFNYFIDSIITKTSLKNLYNFY
jgi:hypothetical protein